MPDDTKNEWETGTEVETDAKQARDVAEAEAGAAAAEDSDEVEAEAEASDEDDDEDDEPTTALGKFRDFLENATESTIFASRWLLAPVFLGLVVALLAVMVNFIYQLWGLLPHFPTMTIDEIASNILNLIDLALLGNLLLIVIFSGYENFVSKINPAEDHEDRPEWMGTLDFSGLKMKIVGSVVAISLVELLQDFIQMAEHNTFDPQFETWRIALHLTFVISGLLFAVMDYVAEKRHGIAAHPGERKHKKK